MQFEPFDYMVWAKRHPRSVRRDLSASGMPPPSPELFPLEPELVAEGLSHFRRILASASQV